MIIQSQSFMEVLSRSCLQKDVQNLSDQSEDLKNDKCGIGLQIKANLNDKFSIIARFQKLT